MIIQERHYLAFFVFILSLIIPFLYLQTGNPLFLVGFFAFLAFPLISNLNYLMIFSLWAAAIGLKIPIGRLTAYDITLFGFILLSMARHTMRKKKELILPAIIRRCVCFFIANLFLIISFRGFGLLGLGDAAAGGGQYIQWLIMLVAFLLITQISLSERETKVLVVGWVILPMLNPLMEWIIVNTGAPSYFLAKFFDLNVSQLILQIGEGEGVRVLSSPIALFLKFFAMYLLATKRNYFLYIVCFTLGAIAVMQSGFRSFLLAYVITCVVSSYLLIRQKVTLSIIYASLGFLFLLLAVAFIDVMPFAIQRSLSFIPGLVPEGEATINANATVDWRLEIWRIAWSQMQHYVLVGRGLTWEIGSWSWLTDSWYQTPEFYFANHNYHSGPITLLIDYGFIGTFIWIAFQLSTAKHLYGMLKYAISNSSTCIISVFYIVGYITYVWEIFHFWVLYGQTISMMRFFLFYMLLFFVRHVLSSRQIAHHG